MESELASDLLFLNVRNYDNRAEIVGTELGLHWSGGGGSFYKKNAANHLLVQTSCNITVT